MMVIVIFQTTDWYSDLLRSTNFVNYMMCCHSRIVQSWIWWFHICFISTTTKITSSTPSSYLVYSLVSYVVLNISRTAHKYPSQLRWSFKPFEVCFHWSAWIWAYALLIWGVVCGAQGGKDYAEILVYLQWICVYLGNAVKFPYWISLVLCTCLE